jgi:hypothetical protein
LPAEKYSFDYKIVGEKLKLEITNHTGVAAAVCIASRMLTQFNVAACGCADGEIEDVLLSSVSSRTELKGES